MTQDKRINILFVESARGFGGSTKSLFYLIKFLDKKRFNPFLVFTEAEINTCDFKPLCSKIFSFKRKRYLGYRLINKNPKSALLRYIAVMIELIFWTSPEFLKFIKIIKQNRINILHVNDGITSNFSAVLAAKLTNIGIIAHMRSTQENEMKKTQYSLIRNKISKNFVDTFIAVSKERYEQLNNTHGINDQRKVFVRNGVDVDEFNPANLKNIRSSLGLDEDGVCVTVISNFLHRKGQYLFVKAAKAIVTKYPETKFILVGKEYDKDYAKAVFEKIKELDISKYFLLLGYRNDVPNIINSSDLIVMPAVLPEGCPRVLMEAMALSKPLIGSDVGGIRELVNDGENGFLFQAGNSKVLAEKICELIENKSLLQKMGITGRKIVEERFDVRKNTKKVEDVYREILLKRKKQKTKPKNKIKEIFISSPAMNCFEIFSRNFFSGIPILMYHKITEKYNPYFSGLDKGVFEQQMGYIRKNFSVISLNEAVSSLEKKKKITKNCIVLTFDDGYKSVYKYAYPILSSYGIPATVFLTVENVDKQTLQWFDLVKYLIKNTKKNAIELPYNGNLVPYSLETDYERLTTANFIKEDLKKTDPEKRKCIISTLVKQCNVDVVSDDNTSMLNWTEIRDLAKYNFDFGTHTLSHPILPKLNNEDILKEVSESKAIIENKTGKKINLFCYPNGLAEDFDERTKRILKNAGYKAACTAIEGLNRADSDLFELKRISTSTSSLNVFRYYLAKKRLTNA